MMIFGNTFVEVAYLLVSVFAVMGIVVSTKGYRRIELLLGTISVLESLAIYMWTWYFTFAYWLFPLLVGATIGLMTANSKKKHGPEIGVAAIIAAFAIFFAYGLAYGGWAVGK